MIVRDRHPIGLSASFITPKVPISFKPAPSSPTPTPTPPASSTPTKSFSSLATTPAPAPAPAPAPSTSAAASFKGLKSISSQVFSGTLAPIGPAAPAAPAAPSSSFVSSGSIPRVNLLGGGVTVSAPKPDAPAAPPPPLSTPGTPGTPGTPATTATPPALTSVAQSPPPGTYVGGDGRLYQDPSYYPPPQSSGGGGGIGPAASAGYVPDMSAQGAPAAPSGMGELFTPKNLAIGAALFVGSLLIKKALHV